MIFICGLVVLVGAALSIVAARRRSRALTPAIVGTLLGAFAVLGAASIGMYVAVVAALVLAVAGARLGRDRWRVHDR